MNKTLKFSEQNDKMKKNFTMFTENKELVIELYDFDKTLNHSDWTSINFNLKEAKKIHNYLSNFIKEMSYEKTI